MKRAIGRSVLCVAVFASSSFAQKSLETALGPETPIPANSESMYESFVEVLCLRTNHTKLSLIPRPTASYDLLLKSSSVAGKPTALRSKMHLRETCFSVADLR